MFSWLEKIHSFCCSCFVVIAYAGIVEVLPIAENARPIEGKNLIRFYNLQGVQYILKIVVMLVIHSLFVHLNQKQIVMVCIL